MPAPTQLKFQTTEHQKQLSPDSNPKLILQQI